MFAALVFYGRPLLEVRVILVPQVLVGITINQKRCNEPDKEQ